MMPRPCRQLAIPHSAQLAAQRLLRYADLELVPDPLAEVDDPPADHAMHGRDRPALDHGCQRRAMHLAQQRRLARCAAVDQAVRAAFVEPQHPIAHHLQCHAADARRLGPARPVIDRRQRQQAPDLIGILALPRRNAQARRIEVRPQQDRHGRTPRFPSLESEPHRAGQALRVLVNKPWYYTNGHGF
jgi:hypothetical protein